MEIRSQKEEQYRQLEPNANRKLDFVEKYLKGEIVINSQKIDNDDELAKLHLDKITSYREHIQQNPVDNQNLQLKLEIYDSLQKLPKQDNSFFKANQTETPKVNTRDSKSVTLLHQQIENPERAQVYNSDVRNNPKKRVVPPQLEAKLSRTSDPLTKLSIEQEIRAFNNQKPMSNIEKVGFLESELAITSSIVQRFVIQNAIKGLKDNA